MQIVPTSSIIIPKNRQRREFDAESLMLLAESIRSKGLLHAIIVRQVENQLYLVAGERRLRAIGTFEITDQTFLYDNQLVEIGFAPVIDIGELDDLSVEEAELEENTRRADLTWQERAAAENRLHTLRVAQAEARNETHTMRQTADEIAGPETQTTRTRTNIILGNHLDKPEVSGAKTAREAFKALKKLETNEQNAALAIAVGKTFSAADHTLLNEDALIWLKSCHPNTFDILLVDPPYGMGADEFGDAGGSLSQRTHDYVDNRENLVRIIEVFGPESFRVAKDQAHLYLFCDIEHFDWIKDTLSLCSWKVHRTPFIWHKPKSHRVPWPDQGPRRHYELILYAVKGNKPTNHIAPDVLSYNLDEHLGHPAQKPIALLKDLLSRSGLPGSKVVDCFCGTASTIIAAHELQMIATGVEMSVESYGIAAKRLQGLK